MPLKLTLTLTLNSLLTFIVSFSRPTNSLTVSRIWPPHTIRPTHHPHPHQTPVVIWHGLGDAYTNHGITELAKKIDSRYPDTPVYLIRMAESAADDRRATWFGSANAEVESACDQLSHVKDLASGFDGIGFSQGGQLMRAYVERCNSPKVRNLITLGAQHMGISGFQPCRSIFDVGCHVVHKLIESESVYGSYAQQNIIPAQYFRDQANLSPYMLHNEFLRDINNERWNDTQPVDGALHTLSGEDEPPYEPRNQTYKANFQSLENFVMFRFTVESLVIPPTSAYFTIPNATRNGLPDVLDPIPIALQDLPIYKDDYIGLKVLDEAGRIHYGTCVGEHMIINEACWEDVMDWLGNIQPQSRPNSFEMDSPFLNAISTQVIMQA